MVNTQNPIVYAVNSDLDDGILYAEFATKEEAIDYAKKHMDKLPFVDELEVSYDANGEIDNVFSYKTVWAHNEEEVVSETEDDYWNDLETMYDEEQASKHDLGDTTWFESMDNLVETLEESEDTVECKECFDLFPKADCIKLDIGYVCPTCAEGGVVSEDEIFKIDFPEYEKFSDGNTMIPEEPMISEEPIEEIPAVDPEDPENEIDPISTPEEAVPFLVKDEEEAIAGYEKAAEVVEESDLENKEEILNTIEHIKEEEEEHIEELLELVDTKEEKEEEASEDENDPVSEEEEVEETTDSEEDPEEELEESFSPMTKDDLYDRLVNKGEAVDLDVGDQGYTPEDTGSFSDGGYYGGSVIYIEFDNGKFGATEFYRSESGDEKEGYWDFETESFDELWDEIMNTFKPEDLVEHINEEHPEVAADVEEGIELTDVR